MKREGKISLGIIGAGGIAKNIHLPALAEIEGVEVKAICDIVEARAAALAKSFSIPKTYTLYREMLAKESLDGVLVLLQPDQLFRATLDCLDAGKDVFSEKPPGITLFQAETLARKAAAKGLLLQVGFNRRYIPVMREALRIVRERAQISHVEGTFFKRSTASFYDGCASAFECDSVHVIDALRWAAGSEVVKAATIAGRRDSEVDNAWSSVMSFENGVTGVLKANYQTAGRVHNFEFHGPGASAFINLGFGNEACEAEILLSNKDGGHSISAAGAGALEKIHLDGRKLASSDSYWNYYGYKQELVEFAGCLRDGGKPLCDIEDAAKTMKLVELLRASRI